MSAEDTVQSANTIKILHIENEPCLVSALSRVLRKALGSVEMASASTGEEAKKLMKSHEWSVIISDWELDGAETGGDIYRTVQESFPYLCERYIFLSSNQNARLLATGVGVPYIDKPFTNTAVIKAVQDILHRV